MRQASATAEGPVSGPSAAAAGEGQGRLRRHPVRWWALVSVPVVAALVVVLAWAPAGSRVVQSPLLGRSAPELRGTTLDGDPFDLAALRGRYVLVNFFATWCVPCREEHDDLVRFHDRHAPLGDAAVVSVAFDDRPADVRAFFEEHGGSWPVVQAEGADVAFGVRGVPESYLVDPDGFVLGQVVGGVRDADLEQMLAAAKRGEGW